MQGLSSMERSLQKLQEGAPEDWYMVLPDRKRPGEWKLIYYCTGKAGAPIYRRKWRADKRLELALSADDVQLGRYLQMLRKHLTGRKGAHKARVITLSGYVPSERQWAYHASTADELLYGGAAGGGKSAASVMDALFRCLDYPGSTAYLFRRTYPELEDTLIKEALNRIPAVVGWYTGANHIMHLCNGSRLIFRYCEGERDVTRYQGAEIQWLYFDEMTHFSKAVYDYLNTRKRAPKALKITEPLATRGASNPGGIGHAWVKARFVAPHPQGGEHVEHTEITHEKTGEMLSRDLHLAFVPAKVWDNPHISTGYIFELEDKPEALKKALKDGSWDAFEGQVFTEWRDLAGHYADRLYTHVIEPFEIPAHWPRWRSFDFGFAKPFSVGWWAVAPDGRLYRYREWYGGRDNIGIQIPPEEIAKGIAELERVHENGLHVHGVADPSIWDGSRGESVAVQMERHGIYFEPATNDRLPGKMEIHNRLRFSAEGLPGMQFFNTCTDSLRTLPALTYSATRPEDVDTEAEDHAYDEIRYMVMRHPMGVKLKETYKYTSGQLDPLNQLKKGRKHGQ